MSMFLTKWNPVRELTTLHNELDDFFKRSFDLMGGWPPSLLREGWYPAIESYVKEGKLFYRVEVADINPKDINISVVGNRLTMKGERKVHEDINEEDYLMKEFRYGSFERTFTLPEGADSEKIHASYKEGILEISMPYKGEMLPKKIPVEIEGTHGKKKAA
jgi:HSP20 family protein